MGMNKLSYTLTERHPQPWAVCFTSPILKQAMPRIVGPFLNLRELSSVDLWHPLCVIN